MKWKLLAMALSMSCLLSALPVGNPSDPKLLTQGMFQDQTCDFGHPLTRCLNDMSVRFGYYQDNVVDRYLTQNDSSCDENQDTLNSELNTYAGFVAVNFWDRCDLFLTFGTTNYMYKMSLEALGDPPASSQLASNGGVARVYSNNDFSWSIGGRLIAWECGCWTVGLEGQYLQARPHLSYIEISTWQDTTADLTFGSCGMTTKYSEWQIGLGTSYQVGWMVPYIAVKWSGARLDLGDLIFASIPQNAANSRIKLSELKSSKTWGFAVGTSLVSCDMASLTIEARFADEVGYYLNGQLRF